MEAINKYPFNEGDDYWTIEEGTAILSCWDDQSEEFHDENPNREYFQTLSDLLWGLSKKGKRTIKLVDFRRGGTLVLTIKEI